MVAAGTIGTSSVQLFFALVREPGAAALDSLLAGACWIAVLSNLSLSAPSALPDWVRARGLSIFIAVFFGSMTLGSVLWGQVAAAFGRRRRSSSPPSEPSPGPR